LSVIPLGHRTYLDAKAEGENSMFGKPRRNETTKVRARRGPDGMVNARLREPQYPSTKTKWADTVVRVRCFRKAGRSDRSENGVSNSLTPDTLQGSQVAVSNHKDTNGAPTAVLNVTQARNAGLPKGREPYGNGDPIVVRGRESLPQDVNVEVDP
jgi:hypothetical protein